MPNYTLYYFNGRGRAEILRMMFAAAGVKYMDKRFEFNEWDKYRKDMPSMCVPVLEVDGGMRMPETMAIARYLAREYNFYPKNNMEMMRCDYIADCFYEIMHDYMRYFHWKNGRFRFNVGGTAAKVMSPSGMPVAAGGAVGAVGAGGAVGTGGAVGANRAVGGGGAVAVPGAVGRSGSVGRGGSVGGGGAIGGGGAVGGGATGGGIMAPNYDTYMQWRYMNTCHRVLPFLERTLDMHHGGKHFFMGEHMMWCDMMCYCCLESPSVENQAMFLKFPKMMALRTRVAAHPKIAMYLRGRCKSTW